MKNRKLKADNYHIRHTERSFKNQLRRKASVKLRINQKLIEERLKNKPNWNTNDVVSQFLSADPPDVSKFDEVSESSESSKTSESNQFSESANNESDENNSENQSNLSEDNSSNENN